MTKITFTIAATAFLRMAGPGITFAQEPKAFDSLQMKGVAVVNVPFDFGCGVPGSQAEVH